MSIHVSPPPRCGEQVDPDQYRQFLRTLDPKADWFTIQTFTDCEPQPEPDPLAQVIDIKRVDRAVFALYERGAGVWVTINDTQGKGRKKPAVVRVRAVWQEDDEGFEGEFPLDPSLVVETSPGHFHRYWLVDGDWCADEQGHKDFDGVMHRMVASYGSDPGAKGINRVLRVPGFLHRKKPAEPHMVRMVGGNRQRHAREKILAAFPPFEPHASAKGNGYAGTGESYSELVRQVVSGDHYHPALLALAWRQVGAGIPAGMVVEFLRGLMMSMPQEGRDARWHSRYSEIPRLVSSAAEKKSTDVEAWLDPVPLPAGLLPVARFDYDMLPANLESRVKDISERMQCPPDSVAAPMMTAAGSLIGRKVTVRPKRQDDWSVVPNQWNLNIALSGFMKTPAFNEVLRPVRSREARAREEFRLAKRVHAGEMKAIATAMELQEKSAKDEAKKVLEKNKKADIKELLRSEAMEMPEAPVQRRYTSVNTSAEALGEILKGNPNGLIVTRDEMMALLHQLDEDGQSTAREFYMIGWDGDTDYNFDRIGRGADNYIPAVCLSAIGGTQPERIAQYVDQIRRGSRGNDGLLQRFGLMVCPDTQSDWADVDRHPNAMARDMATKVFEKLDEMTAAAVGARQDKIGDKEVGLPYLRFSPEAQAVFVEWRGALEHRIRGGDQDLDPMMASHLAKYRKLVPGLALIIHLVDWNPVAGAAGDVSVEAVQKALNWAAYLETHAARVYGSGDTALVAAAKAIIAKIKSGHLKGDGFRSHDVWRPQWSRLRDREVVKSALKLLADYDWVGVSKVETNGRAATIYVVNPKVLAS